ncbi:Uncharacterised protein [Brucella anthropi]|nr:Uncharacterised protein [Brucella anthropi]
MFHLNARIDLDEVEFAGIGIHQIFDRACTDIIRGTRNLQRVGGELLTLCFAQIGRGRTLDDLLITPLDRTITLEQMHDIAVRVAENLAFDVTRTLDQLFEIDFVLAEGRLGLALGFRHLAGKVFLFADGAHATATTAPGCLEHDRITDLLGHTLHFRHVVRQWVGGGNNGNANRNRQITGGDLVAELAHRIRRRSDEGDARLVAGLHEFGAFRQKTVTGMNRVRSGELRNADHLLDRKIALDRSHILGEMRPPADLIGLVRFEAVQRQLVLFRPNRNGFNPELVGCPENADRNFGSVGNKYFRDRHDVSLQELGTRNALSPCLDGVV